MQFARLARARPALLGLPLARLSGRARAPAFGAARRRTFTAAAESAAVVEQPTGLQLRRLFVTAAVPFVAFGFMDQTVLIYMGETIDMTLGVRFGLPTLGAAAVGQIFSDTSGVLFGGTIEALATKLGLPLPGLTDAQRMLRSVKRVSLMGSVAGVITGCCLGMVNLLFIDWEAAERAKRAEELKSIMKTVIDGGRNVLGCARAALWIVDEEKGELWSSVIHEVDNIIRIPLEESASIASWVANRKELVNIPDVTKDERWQGNHGTKQPAAGYWPKSMLCAPVFSKGNRVVAVIQLLDKSDEKGQIIPFDAADEKALVLMAGHTRIFMFPEDADEEMVVDFPP